MAALPLTCTAERILCDHVATDGAVPVREELLGQVAELGLRLRRAALRPLAMGRERLDARLQRLPRPEALLTVYVQRLDDQGDRLRRALAERAAIARTRLQDIAGRLSLPLLRGRIESAGERLASARLVPAMVLRRIAESRRAVDGLARMAEQLSPVRVLARGYAIVRDGQGRPLMTAAAAGRADALEIEFADGRLAAGAPGRGGSARAVSPARPKPSDSEPRSPTVSPPVQSPPVQGKLL